jgi:uncharacterized protein YecT (DUF1311 family)
MLLRMMKIAVAGMLLAICALRSAGQGVDPEARLKAICEPYLKTPLPTEATEIPVPKIWPECVSYRLEAGIGAEVDYAAARRCAWAERLATQADLEPRYTVASVLGGSALLSMLYANGEGVERNIPLASRFVCEAGGAPFDVEALLDELNDREKSPKDAKGKFSFCDQTGSGFMQGFCAGLEAEVQDLARASELDGLSSRWSSQQRGALDALVRAQQTYAQAHAKGEINLAGTARAAEEFGAEEELRNNFLAALRSFEKGSPPQGSTDDLARADAELNRFYRRALSEAESKKSEYGAVQPNGIREAERGWLKYRDAWIAFAKLRYPTVGADAWLTLLTNDRTAVLKDTECEIGIDGPACADREDEHPPRPLP